MGEIEKDGNVLVIKRIHVTYRLEVSPDADRAAIDRVMGFHQDKCPVARSIHPQIQVSTSMDVVERTEWA